MTCNGIVLPRYGTMVALFDLSCVQQIAGPQGTLYGGSAAGGAINLLSMKPSADFSGDLLLDGGNYDQVHMAANQNLRASDQLSFRVSADRSEEHTSELQSLMRISYAVFCLKKKKKYIKQKK